MKIFYCQPMENELENEEIFNGKWYRMNGELKRAINFHDHYFDDPANEDPIVTGFIKDLCDNPDFELIYQFNNHRDLISDPNQIVSPMDHLKLDLDLAAASKYIILDGDFRKYDNCRVIYTLSNSMRGQVLTAVKGKYGILKFKSISTGHKRYS